jgi:hypothetical protein
MTLLFRVQIEDEVHHVRVEMSSDQPAPEDAALEEFVLTTAYLEHYGRLPRGVTNTFD